MPRGSGRLWISEADVSKADARRWLLPPELSFASRLINERVRQSFITSRMLQRALGANYLQAPAHRVEITRKCLHCGHDRHGNPHFPAAPELDFSVSHSGTLVAMAASTGGKVGLDMETSTSNIGVDELRRNLTSDAERRNSAELNGEAARCVLF
ncbi:4'-phosphopantetheinyl transferase family protein [Streptomyces sp. NPDC057253]|uniref:4'-phosphopantetheinyl transferase family protein n=1 Tax=Streptomyces sp. NPDC057253 TaxID=3346069 RepID=UPI00363EFF69